MNKKRIVVSSLIIFVTSLLYNGLVHGVLLKDSYNSIRHILRENMNQMMWLSLLATLVVSFLFVFNFTKWTKGKGVTEGIYYGIFFAFLIGIFVDVNQYVMYPLPMSLVVKWFASGLVEFVLCGIIVSLLYKGIHKA